MKLLGYNGSDGATSVDMTKHFYDIRLHDLIYIYITK